MSIVLEHHSIEPETQVDDVDDREGGSWVAVAATEPWFLLGRLDRREYRVVRADRLAASIGPDVHAWWLYPDEAFDSKQAAALALVDLLDPAGWRQKPRTGLLVLEQDLGAALARLHPTQREAFAQAIAFMLERILSPFEDSSQYEQFRATDEDGGQGWSNEQYNDYHDLLRQLQALLEGKHDTPIIISATGSGANPGGDCGDRADGTS